MTNGMTEDDDDMKVVEPVEMRAGQVVRGRTVKLSQADKSARVLALKNARTLRVTRLPPAE